MKPTTLLILSLLFASLAGAQEPTWWRSLTPQQQRSISCEVEKDDPSLVKLLRPLGWDETRFPNNDWSTSYVVVIAPNHFHRGYHLGLIEERKTDDSLEFRWGWVTPQTSNPGGPPNPDGSGGPGDSSHTIGSAHEGNEAIVVAFPKDELTGRTVTCSEVPLS